MKRVLSWVLPIAPLRLAYMLQQFEYDTTKFTRWMLGYPNLWDAQRRGTYVLTKRGRAAQGYALTVYWAWVLLVLVAGTNTPTYLFALLLSGAITAYMLIALNGFMQVVVVGPRQRREIAKAQKKLLDIPAARIAVLGSFGKTSMKELLMTVLSEAKMVSATPGNKNVLISHARWASKLTGNEEVLIIEYGEAAPGDIRRFADYSKPTHAVVTGLAPAHLDYYPSLESIRDDFASILEEVDPQNVWFSDHSPLLHDAFEGAHAYSAAGMTGCKVANVKIDFDGMSFTVSEGKQKTTYHTGLLGEHQLGPIVAVIDIARKLGLSTTQIKHGLEKAQPYEHRMQPKPLHEAWIIDDAYNGNIEGMKAGLKLLMELPAKRRIYVTPGLVDQGSENEQVHHELGKRIAQARPDRVVLMQNSSTNYIISGLEEIGYHGELIIETDPLGYYIGLEHQVAAGDVVMLQNDLPDAYK